jgi:hypothetical protein
LTVATESRGSPPSLRDPVAPKTNSDATNAAMTTSRPI